MPGEFDFISWVLGQQRPSPLVSVPAGDDLAVLTWPASDLLLVGVDQVLDGVHFDSATHTPQQIGRKVMNRNLSDCAAMACLPAAAVATVALPRGSSLEFCKELYRGMKEAADMFCCEMVGGDTASWTGPLVVTVTILGRSAGVQPLTRRGARPGDTIYVTGPLGGSILGRHMSFEPRIVLAREIARTGHATAMIDLSDGLSRDLRHICEQSGVGAIIHASQLPIHPDVARLPPGDKTPVEHALHDGEDHELLFTAWGGAFPDGVAVGRVTSDRQILLETAGRQIPLSPRGWEHRL